MAFVKNGNWESEGDPLHRRVAVDPALSSFEARLGTNATQAIWRGRAIALTIALHSLLLLVVAQMAFGPKDNGETRKRGAGTTLFDLTGLFASDIDPGARFEALRDTQQTPPETPPSPVDLSTPSEFAPEWTMGRLRLIALSAAPDATLPTPVVGKGNAGLGTGVGTGGNGNIYDPYAGAAPKRRIESDSSAVQAVLSIDAMVLADIIRTIRRTTPSLRGRFELMLTTSSAGLITGVEFGVPGLAPQPATRIRSALIGKRITDPKPSGIANLDALAVIEL